MLLQSRVEAEPSAKTRYPIGAEARGRLRLWQAAAQRRHEALQQVLQTKSFDKAAIEYSRPSASRRTRSLLALDAMLTRPVPLAWRETDYVVRSGSRYPIAVWACVQPTSYSVGSDYWGADERDGASIGVIAIGRLTAKTYMHTSAWTMMVMVHALGRLLQRDPNANVDAVLLEAHRNLLNIRDGLFSIDSFWIPAGEGGFICTPLLMDNQGDPAVMVRLHTWIHDGQVYDAQRVEYTKLTTGKTRQGRFNWFLPHPLRSIEFDELGDKTTNLVIMPSMYAIEAFADKEGREDYYRELAEAEANAVFEALDEGVTDVPE